MNIKERIVGTIYDRKNGLEGKLIAHLLQYTYLTRGEK